MDNEAVTRALTDVAREQGGSMEVPLASELWPVTQMTPDDVRALADALRRRNGKPSSNGSRPDAASSDASAADDDHQVT